MTCDGLSDNGEPGPTNLSGAYNLFDGLHEYKISKREKTRDGDNTK